MNNNSIEDILIENHGNKKNKKGGGVFVLLMFFAIVLAALCSYYFYMQNNPVQVVKPLFFSAISNIDLDFYTNNEIYNEILSKYEKNNSKTEATVTASTTMNKPDELADIDISKFALNLNTINKINTKETYGELGILYSDNELIKIKSINNEKQCAFFSDEIVNKYVGFNKENYKNISDSLNFEFLEFDVLDSFKNISKEESTLNKNEKLKEILTYTSEMLNEEKFSSQNNFVLERGNSENINVTAYGLKLTNQEYSTLIKNILTKIRNDENFISSIVTGNKIQQQNVDFTIKATTNLDPVGTGENINQEANTINEENITENIEESTIENTTEKPQENTTLNAQESIEENTQNTITQETLEEYLDSKKNPIDINKIMLAILLNRKLDCTVEDVQNTIDYSIENIEIGENDFEFNVYVSENATEKINIKLPNLSTIDIEFKQNNENEKNVIITYLKEDDGLKYGEDNAVIYSAADNTITETIPVVTEKQTNGFKLDFYKRKSDASTKLKITYNFIENKEINKKISINLVTDGTSNSKNFENEGTIIYTTNDGELKINIENEINFGINAAITPLTEENSLFLDTLPIEELIPTIDAIKEKITTVYNEKKQSLSFYDTNTQTSLIKPTIISKDEARTILIDTISLQMGDAQNRGEIYTIQNLEGLEISGHQVNVVLENGVAIVTLDGHRFEINADFVLTDID